MMNNNAKCHQIATETQFNGLLHSLIKHLKVMKLTEKPSIRILFKDMRWFTDNIKIVGKKINHHQDFILYFIHSVGLCSWQSTECLFDKITFFLKTCMPSNIVARILDNGRWYYPSSSYQYPNCFMDIYNISWYLVFIFRYLVFISLAFQLEWSSL